MGSALGNGRRALAEEVPVGYKRTEVGVIPEDWNAVLLGDLFVFKNGLNKAKQFFGSGTPIVNYMDVFEHPGIRMNDLSGRVNLSPEEIKNFEVRLGDVFFTRTSETVEEIGVASVMLDEPCDTVFSGFVLRARPRNSRLDDRYKQYCFGPRAVRSQIISNATYTTRALTNGRSLSAVWIAVPSKPEQRAIAEALSDVDELLAALEELIAKKRAVKQAAMQQLLTGKSRLPGFSGKWETTTLGKVADLKNGYAFKSSTYVLGGMYQIITITNVQDGHLNLNTVNTISELPSDLQDHQQLSHGDILISMTGNVGRVCIVKEPHCLLNQRVGKLVARKIDPLFLYHVVHDRRFLLSMIEMAVGGAQGNLGKSDITGYSCFLSKNLVEQRTIATVLSDMDAEIAALERRRDKTRAIKQGMMQQLLTGRVRLVKSEQSWR